MGAGCMAQGALLSVIMGKEFEKEWTPVYLQLNHFSVYLKLLQHCSSTIRTIKYKVKKKILFLNSNNKLSPKEILDLLIDNKMKKNQILRNKVN